MVPLMVLDANDDVNGVPRWSFVTATYENILFSTGRNNHVSRPSFALKHWKSIKCRLIY